MSSHLTTTKVSRALPSWASLTAAPTTGDPVAGGPAPDGVTPAPLGDINNLPGAGQPSTVPLTGAPTPPTGAPAAGGGQIDEAHRNWESIGDPHISMGNERFDNTHKGDFVILESADKAYQVQTRQEAFADGSVANTAAAIKDGDNVVSYDVKTKKLAVNGQEWDGRTQPPGMTIARTAGGYDVTSSKGDRTSIQDKGHYLDLKGSVGPDRQVGEIRGAHGVFDNTDGTESHIKRDGTQAANRDEMIDSWKARPDENLFAKAAGGPAAAGTGGAKPADVPGAGGPAAPDDIKALLEDVIKQLKELITNLEKLLAKLGGAPGAAPAAVGPAAAQDGKGGPAAAPANFADQKKADKGADAAPKTFADQKKEDEARAAAAAGKGGPAPAGAAKDEKAKDEKAKDEKAKDAAAAGAKAAEAGKGGPAAVDPLKAILEQLQDLIKTLTGLIEKLQARQGALPKAA